MARDLSGSGQYFERGSAVVSGPPFTMVCWAFPDTIATDKRYMNIGEIGSINNWFRMRVDAGDPKMRFSVKSTSSVFQTTTSVNMTTGEWQHCCCIAIATNSRAVYRNGTAKGTNTSSVTPSGVNQTTVGSSTGGGEPFDGRMCEAAIWSVVLTDAEVLRLFAEQLSALFIRPDKLVFYDPMIREDDGETIGGPGMTKFGTPGVASHPRIIRPAWHYVVSAPAAVVAAPLPRIFASLIG